MNVNDYVVKKLLIDLENFERTFTVSCLQGAIKSWDQFQIAVGFAQCANGIKDLIHAHADDFNKGRDEDD